MNIVNSGRLAVAGGLVTTFALQSCAVKDTSHQGQLISGTVETGSTRLAVEGDKDLHFTLKTADGRHLDILIPESTSGAPVKELQENRTGCEASCHSVLDGAKFSGRGMFVSAQETQTFEVSEITNLQKQKRQR